MSGLQFISNEIQDSNENEDVSWPTEGAIT